MPPNYSSVAVEVKAKAVITMSLVEFADFTAAIAKFRDPAWHDDTDEKRIEHAFLETFPREGWQLAHIWQRFDVDVEVDTKLAPVFVRWRVVVE